MPRTLTSALRREHSLPYVYLAPSVLVLAVFGVLPVLFTVVMSLLRWNAGESLAEVRLGGLSNFVWIFGFGLGRDFGGALQGQLWFTLVAGFFIHVTAIPLAAFINQAFRRWRPAVLALYFLPFLTGGIIVFIIFSALFSSSESGLVNSAFTTLGNATILGVKPLALFFPTKPVDWLWRNGPLVGVLMAWWAGLGWNVLLYVTALQYVPKVLLEAARIDGAGPWQVLLHVLVPQLRPMIFFATSLTVVAGVSSGGPWSLAGFMEGVAYQEGDYGATAAMAVIVLLVLAGMIYALWAWVGGRPALPRTARPGEVEAPRRAGWGWRVGRWALGALAAAWAWLRGKLLAPESADPGNLRGFDGMRAIACLLVIVHHLALRLDGDWSLPWVVQPLWRLGLLSNMGVAVFFVLSGALLSMPFWQRFLDGRGPPALGEYAVRRAARILPGYWAALGAAVGLGLWAVPAAKFVAWRFWAGATFTSAFHYVTFFPSELDPVLWSISLEVVCYLLLPLCLLPMWRLLPDRAPRRAARYLLWVLVGLQVAHLAIIAIFPTDDVEKGWRYGMIGGAKEWLPSWSPASFMTQFLLGGAAALAIAWRQRTYPRRSPDHDRVAGVALLAAWILYAFFGSGERGTGINTFTRQPYITPLFPAAIAVGLYAMQFGVGLPRWIDNRLFRFLSRISFGLYLWHYLVIELVRVWWYPEFTTQPVPMRDVPLWMGLSAGVIAVSVLLAWISWHVIEEPVLRWARSRRVRPIAAPPEVTP
jgi:peptidoglycan/LPS O-acetylase OafA/YrhL/ABC-type sugar transport system permease subunit